MTATEWTYSGDVNLEYGGTFIKVDPREYRWGYLEAVEVTDLDSAAGATGMVLIEAFTVIIDRQGKGRHHMRDALESQGTTLRQARELFFKDRSKYMFEMARAALSYGRRDPRQPAHMWDTTPPSEIVQTVPGAPMKSDGWRAEKFIDPKDLKGYVEKTWLD